MATLGSLRVSLETDTSRLVSGLARAQGRIRAFGGGVAHAFRAARTSALVASGAMATAAVGVGALARRGSEVEALAASFERLSASVGTTGGAMLRAPRDATGGLIDDLDLMQASNQAILLGLPVTTSEMSRLASTAIVLGRAVGGDGGASQALKDLLTGLGRASPEILDNLGLTISAADAYGEFAAAVGKTAGELTKAEKQQAIYNAAMTAAEVRVAELGGLQQTLGDRITGAWVTLKNWVDMLARAIAASPELMAAMVTLGNAVRRAFGPENNQLIERLVALVVRAGGAFAAIGEIAAQTAGVIIRVFGAALRIVSNGASSLVSVMALVPGASSRLGALQNALEGVASTADTMSEGSSLLGGVLSDLRDVAADVGFALDNPPLFAAAAASADAAAPAIDAVAVAATGAGVELGALGDPLRETTTAARSAADVWREQFLPPLASTHHEASVLYDRLNALPEPITRTQEAARSASDVWREQWVPALASSHHEASVLYDRLTFLAAPIVETTYEARSAADAWREQFVPALESSHHEASVLYDALEAKPDGFFGPIRASLRGLLTGLTGGQGLTGFFAQLGEGLVTALGARVEGAVAALTNWATGHILGALRNFGWRLRDLFGGLSELEVQGRAVADAFGDWADEMVDAQGEAEILALVQEGWNESLARQVAGVRSEYRRLGIDVELANEHVEALWNAIQEGPDAVEEAWDRIRDRIESVGSAAQDAGAELDHALRRRELESDDSDLDRLLSAPHSPGPVGPSPHEEPRSSIVIPAVPALAHGGIVHQPTVALIGEAGPEAVVPLSAREESPTRRMLERIEHLLAGQEDAMIRAWRVALQTV